jgi:hypothetical protein
MRFRLYIAQRKHSYGCFRQSFFWFSVNFLELMMSDNAALEAERETLVNEMSAMQKQFMDLEHEKGISPREYYTATDGLLKDYRHSYMEKAMRVAEISRILVHGH